MRIYICDKCGEREIRTNGIVGHEFDHSTQTLDYPYRRNGIVDVCKPCLAKYEAARTSAVKTERERTNATFWNKLRELFAI